MLQLLIRRGFMPRVFRARPARAFAVAILCAAVVAALSNPALAAGTGIGVVDTGKTAIVTAIQGFAGLAAIVLLAIGIWGYIEHRNLKVALFEFVGVLAAGLLAGNAQSVAGVFGLGGGVV
jgi:hypothetical protein